MVPNLHVETVFHLDCCGNDLSIVGALHFFGNEISNGATSIAGDWLNKLAAIEAAITYGQMSSNGSGLTAVYAGMSQEEAGTHSAACQCVSRRVAQHVAQPQCALPKPAGILQELTAASSTRAAPGRQRWAQPRKALNKVAGKHARW